MDIQEIRNIIDLMKRSDLSEFEIEEDGFKLRIKRGMGLSDSAPTVIQASAPTPPVAGQAPEAAVGTGSANTSADDGYEIIKSPMVGTFYRSSSPDSPPFVENGASVNPDTLVCIIEAMKVMNEIQADISGTIVEILVENEQSVEYNQPLFKVKPA